jgi:HprK-related kinase A
VNGFQLPIARLSSPHETDGDANRLAKNRDTSDPIHFQIGVVPLTLRSVFKPALHQFRDLYRTCETPTPSPDAIDIRVIRTRNGRSLRRRYEVWGDGALRFTVWDKQSILPHIEWAINWQIMLYLPRYYQIHAGVLNANGQGVVFPASPGSGKTTLTAGLVQRGWKYFSDEFALIDPRSLDLYPFPKALCIKQGSFDTLESLGVDMHSRRHYLKGKKGCVALVSPHELAPDPIAESCPVRHVVFCNYQPDTRPTMREISRADAVIRLNQQSFNFVKFRAQGVRIMADIVRDARCYKLVAGQIHETCDLVAQNVGR